jgi:hypothetical protein
LFSYEKLASDGHAAIMARKSYGKSAGLYAESELLSIAVFTSEPVRIAPSQALSC